MPKRTIRQKIVSTRKKLRININDKSIIDVKTPKSILTALRKEFKELFDPCPYGGIKYKGNPKKDGLLIPWSSTKVNFVNPPYNEIEKWLKKGLEEIRQGKTCVFLITARTHTKYWNDYIVKYASEIRFITGTVKFGGYEQSKGLPIGIAIIVFKPRQRKHRKIGHIGDYTYWTV